MNIFIGTKNNLNEDATSESISNLFHSSLQRLVTKVRDLICEGEALQIAQQEYDLGRDRVNEDESY